MAALLKSNGQANRRVVRRIAAAWMLLIVLIFIGNGASAQGTTGTEGIAITGADHWHEAGFTGKGVRVGVLDLGFDGYHSLLGRELPERVNARSFIDGVSSVDATGYVHGSAVAEVIHDMAPDAEISLAAYWTEGEMANAIRWLVEDQGVQIISHSCNSYLDLRDGNGEIARLVDRFVGEYGIVWVNSAGNAAESHYQGIFRDDDSDGNHEFDSSTEAISFTTGPGPTDIVLNWTARGTDGTTFALYILDGDENVIIDEDTGAEAPRWITYAFNNSGPYYLVVKGNPADKPSLLDILIYNGEIERRFATPGGSVLSPADAHLSFTVGAFDLQTGALAGYSSQGPTSDERLKPEISAPSNVSSASYRDYGFNFEGTSAATPHVAGAAALVLQAYPYFTPQQVMNFLINRAVDMGEAGPDNAYGYGLLNLGDLPSVDTTIYPTPTIAETKAGVTAVFIITPTPGTTRTPATPTTIPALQNGQEIGYYILGLLACLAVFGFAILAALLIIILLPAKPKHKPKSQRPHSQGVLKAPAPGQVGMQMPSPTTEPCPHCGNQNKPTAHFCPRCGNRLEKPLPASEAAVQHLPPWPPVPPGGLPQPQVWAGEKPTKPPIAFCRYCGQRLRPGARFCSKCGLEQQ